MAPDTDYEIVIGLRHRDADALLALSEWALSHPDLDMGPGLSAQLAEVAARRIEAQAEMVRKGIDTARPEPWDDLANLAFDPNEEVDPTNEWAPHALRVCARLRDLERTAPTPGLAALADEAEQVIREQRRGVAWWKAQRDSAFKERDKALQDLKDLRDRQ